MTERAGVGEPPATDRTARPASARRRGLAAWIGPGSAQEEPGASGGRLVRLLRALPEPRLGAFAWGGVGVVLAAWAAYYLSWPVWIDQGIFAWVGDVIRVGGMPYKDAWEIRGPVSLYIYAAMGGIAGRHFWGFRLADLVLIALGAMVVARCARRYGGAEAARGAAALYLLWYASHDFRDTLQSEAWTAIFVAAAVLALVTQGERAPLRAAAVAGALLGLCALSKPQYTVFLALPLIYTVARVRRGWRWAARCGVGTALGFLVPVGVVLGWFAYRGALDDLVDVHLRWPIASYTELGAGWFNRFHGVADFLLTGRVLAALPLAITGLAILWRARPADAALVAAWTVTGPLNVALQGRFVGYHWHLLYPPLAVLTGIGVHGLCAAWRAGRPEAAGTPATFGRVFPVAVVATLFAAALMEPLLHVYRWGAYVAGLRTAAEHQAVAFEQFGRTPQSFPAVADYIADHTTPGDAVLFWGVLPQVNYASGRRSPTRFAYTTALLHPTDNAFRRRYRREFLDQLRANLPAYIVAFDDRVCFADSTGAIRRGLPAYARSADCLHALPGLRDIVVANYVAEVQMMSFFDLWRRR